MKPTPLDKTLAIVVPTTWSNDKKGNFLENLAAELLRRQSYAVVERIRFTGMEIDLLAKHKPSGDKVYVECKFHKDPLGANVIDLMIGQSVRRKLARLALFTAGPLGKDAKGAIEDLWAENDSRISFSLYGPDTLLETLVDSSAVPDLANYPVPQSVVNATLLVHPEHPYVWLLQDQRDGTPFRLLPIASEKDKIDPEELRALLDRHELLEGLPVVIPSEAKGRTATQKQAQPQLQEVVGRVTTADTILDYRPCRPEDFVGRAGIQKEVWDFLDAVRSGQTDTRLIAIVGSSGYGKSSLVAKLAERFRNKKWKNKYFLYPVDVRSARGPLFVAEALLESLRNAAEAHFLQLPRATNGLTHAAFSSTRLPTSRLRTAA